MRQLKVKKERGNVVDFLVRFRVLIVVATDN